MRQQSVGIFFFLHLKNLYRMVRSNKFVQDGEIRQIQMRWQKFTNSYEHGKIVKIWMRFECESKAFIRAFTWNEKKRTVIVINKTPTLCLFLYNGSHTICHLLQITPSCQFTSFQFPYPIYKSVYATTFWHKVQ